MPFYRDAAPVADEPVATLQRWQVMILPNGDRHFCGFLANGKVRISTPIVEFDADTQTGKTQSGRYYRLDGPPSDDCLGGWAIWCRMYGIDWP